MRWTSDSNFSFITSRCTWPVHDLGISRLKQIESITFGGRVCACLCVYASAARTWDAHKRSGAFECRTICYLCVCRGSFLCVVCSPFNHSATGDAAIDAFVLWCANDERWRFQFQILYLRPKRHRITIDSQQRPNKNFFDCHRRSMRMELERQNGDAE